MRDLNLATWTIFGQHAFAIGLSPSIHQSSTICQNDAISDLIDIHRGAAVMPLPSAIGSVFTEIDAANALDPRVVRVAGVARARELIYSERMSECLLRLYPAASDELRIAARAQHICRWQIARTSYPQGRDGYNAWRSACRTHHADTAAAILRKHAYAEAVIEKVCKIIRKEDLKRDAESQALENVAAVVFVEHYFEDFLVTHSDYADERIVTILSKTLRKMDGTGHAAVFALTPSAQATRLITLAVASRREASSVGRA